MGSSIIDQEYLKYELMHLCEFPLCSKWELLCREGGRYNYSQSQFHAQCDSKSPTLVVVKSEEGSIFGGYTEAQWNEPNDPYSHLNQRVREHGNQTENEASNIIVYNNESKKYIFKFKSDPNAFLFILKHPRESKYEKPAKALLAEPNYAIYCDANEGPSFGKFDLVIHGRNYSKNYFKIGSSYKIDATENQQHAVITQPDNFNLKEFEVFRKISSLNI